MSLMDAVRGTDQPWSECRVERQDGSLICTEVLPDHAVEYTFKFDGTYRIAKRRDATTTFVLADDQAGCLPSNIEFPNADSGKE